MVELERFLEEWQKDEIGAKPLFEALKKQLSETSGVRLEFVSRPGVTQSLRAFRDEAARPLVALVDVIDDDPESRWLSVCFYGDAVEDPDEMGDLIPGGLLGEDGYCFDVEEGGPEIRDYLAARVGEALARAV